MNVEVFALCDSATNNQGKLNILGTFDTIMTKQVPLLYPHCALALRLRFNRIEQGEHRLKVQLVDEDGKPLIALFDRPMPFVASPHSPSNTINLVINIQNLKVEQYGEFSVTLTVDGHHTLSLPLFIRPTPMTPPPTVG